ncbi:MAG: glycosyltransferase family 4 protein [Rubrobacteraceae bacterium]
MTRRILVAGSVPLAEPWDGADKNLANLLVRRDPDNHFIVQTGLAEQWSPLNVTAIRSRRADSMPTTAQKLRGLAYLLRHSGSADLIHAVASLYNPSPWMGPALRAWSAIRQRPFVHTVTSTGDAPIARRNFVGDATVVVSEHTRRRLEGYGITNVFRVHPPLEVERLQPKQRTAPEVLARELRLGDRAVLYPTHYAEKSGIREIIQAFSRLHGYPETDDAVLVLACRFHPWQDAEAEKRKVLKQAAEDGILDRVRVLHYVADMPALISACAVTALVPEKLSGKMDLPLVILESLVLGRPVIVADWAPVSEALLGGGGYAVPHGDVPALAASISRLLGNLRLRKELAARGRAAVLKHCSPERVVGHYQRIYERVLEPGVRQTSQESGPSRTSRGDRVLEDRNGAF